MVEAGARWSEIAAWRKARRAELLDRRQALPAVEHHAASAAVCDRLAHDFPVLAAGPVGFYWPYRREIDLRPLIERLIAQGGSAALPVVVDPRGPLEFRLWQPGAAMASGVYDIPYPAKGAVVSPAVLLVALLGFDAAGYRLGYGGGYYDRTLAAARPTPLAIGVGFELGRLATIHPQPHDRPMDYIVTEAGAFARAGRELATITRAVVPP